MFWIFSEMLHGLERSARTPFWREMMRRLLALVMIVYCGGVFAAEPWSEMKAALKPYKATAVHAAEYSYGGTCIRLLGENIKTEADSDKLAEVLTNLQSELPITELHLVHFPEEEAAKLSFLNALPKLKLLNLGGATYDKTELSRLKDFESFETLFLSGDGWDDKAFHALGEVQKIKDMRLQYLRSDNWAEFPMLPNLREVDLGSSNIDDSGAAALAKCSKLEGIHAYETKIGDEGLKELAKLKNLKFLGITQPSDDSTTLTVAGLEEFIKQRPDVTVQTDRPKTPHPPKPPQQQGNPAPGPQGKEVA